VLNGPQLPTEGNKGNEGVEFICTGSRVPDAGADWNMEKLAAGDPRSRLVAALRLALVYAAFVITSLLKRSAEKRKVQVGGAKKSLKLLKNTPIRDAARTGKFHLFGSLQRHRFAVTRRAP
jgi:hypothetical protein